MHGAALRSSHVNGCKHDRASFPSYQAGQSATSLRLPGKRDSIYFADPDTETELVTDCSKSGIDAARLRELGRGTMNQPTDRQGDDYWTTVPRQSGCLPATTGERSELSIEIIEEVEPLGTQFGAAIKKGVPDKLRDALFGQPTPTEAEARQGSSAEGLVHLKTYAILDAAKAAGLVNRLEASGLNYSSLFSGQSAEDYRDVAPYLVQLDEANSFTRQLFTGSRGMHGLWERDVGIYVRSRMELDEVRKHFRKFTRLRDTNEKWYYFRFWDPSVATWIFRIGGSEQKIRSFLFGKKTAPLSSYICKVVGSAAFLSVKNDAIELPATTTQLRYEDIQPAMKAYSWQNFVFRTAKAFYKEFNTPSDMRSDAWFHERCLAARKEGFTIELAIYNYVRSAHVAEKKQLEISKVVHEVKKQYAGFSALEISKFLWEKLAQQEVV